MSKKQKTQKKSKWRFLVVFLVVSIVGLFLWQRSVEAEEGGLYSISSEGKYKIAKVLVIEDDVVHIRLYGNTYENRPTSVDESALFLGTPMDDVFGIGHLPISKQEFKTWEPKLIQKSSVSEEELEGYKIWKESQGGVWGEPSISPVGTILPTPVVVSTSPSSNVATYTSSGIECKGRAPVPKGLGDEKTQEYICECLCLYSDNVNSCRSSFGCQ